MRPRLSIVIPVEVGGSIDRVLESIRQAKYPAELIEIIVAEGNKPSRQRNECIKVAKGDIICFFDSDSVCAPDIFSNALRHYEDPRVAGVGGPNLTSGTDTYLQKAFGYVLGSFFGTSFIRARYRPIGKARPTTDKEIILCNMSIRREVLIKEEGFNEELYPNEENELFYRIGQAGYILIYDPDVQIFRSRRISLRYYIPQMMRYGRGRLEQTLIQPKSLSIVFIIPVIFLLYLVSLFFLPISRLLLALPLGLYGLLDLITTIMISIRERKLGLLFLLPFLFLITHLAYGAGMIWGIIKKIFRIKKKEEVICKVRFAKRFNTKLRK